MGRRAGTFMTKGECHELQRPSTLPDLLGSYLGGSAGCQEKGYQVGQTPPHFVVVGACF